MSDPKVVVLCGSTRFYDAFQRAYYEETMRGHIVLSVGFYPHAAERAHGEDVGCTPEQKRALDDLHLRKIDLADEVLVLNVGGYVGESTTREITYARVSGRPVRYLEPVRSDDGAPVITVLWTAFGVADRELPSGQVKHHTECDVPANEVIGGVKEVEVKAYGDTSPPGVFVAVTAVSEELARATWERVAGTISPQMWWPV